MVNPVWIAPGLLTPLSADDLGTRMAAAILLVSVIMVTVFHAALLPETYVIS